MKCKLYSEITVEIRTQLKTVKITSNIFAVWFEPGTILFWILHNYDMKGSSISSMLDIYQQSRTSKFMMNHQMVLFVTVDTCLPLI